MGIGRLTARAPFAALGVALATVVALLWGGGGTAAGEEIGSVEIAAATDDQSLEATIRRTEFGIPHILADDYAGLGFGYGYAFAKDNICTIADSYVTVRAERSRYFGPDSNPTEPDDGNPATSEEPGYDYFQRGNGFHVKENLNSDFFYQRIIDGGVIEDLLAQPPPAGPVDEIKEGVGGYVAGYNKYLTETGVENLPDSRCRGADWVKPITEMDAYRRFYQLALLASGTIAIDGIGSAQPPATGAPEPPLDPDAIAEQLSEVLPIDGIGSNAYALGAEATDNDRGIVLGNPHFPWDGPERLYESHLTIPGELNVSGASLFGVPLVLIGHTQGLAWSHTVSTAYRFTPFEETLNPADPTEYLYDGEYRGMDRDTVTVEVKTDTGLEDRTRTLYSTHHGPVITGLSTVPLPWTPAKAFTMGDANATNFRYLNHFFFTNRAQSVEDYDQIERDYQGIPWVNSIAADSSGKAYYADIGAVPNVSNAKAATCNTEVGDAAFAALRLPVLNGSLSACEWDTDDDAVAPGIFGYGNMPKLFRDDYVTNSNDSYWLSNPEEPLEGYARIIGDEKTTRALRTRIGLKMLIERSDDADGDFDRPLNRQDVQDIVFNNRQYAGELWRDQLVQMCENAPGGFLLGSPPTNPPGPPQPVDVSGACDVLADWDVTDDLDDPGSVLFRRFATRALSPIVSGVVADPSVFAVPFNPLDPVNTPSGLNSANPKIEQALADAVSDLNKAGIPLNAPLRGYQYEKRGASRIPIHGGPGGLGVFNAINVGWSGSGAEPGYNNVPHGSSFVMVTQFTDGCPDDRFILTYSQSEDSSSPHWGDQTRLYSDKEWVDPPFCEDEVQADPTLSSTTIEGCLAQDAEPPIPAAGPCPAPPDLDADDDGVPDDIDECDSAPGPASNGGCPEEDPGPGPQPILGCTGAINGGEGDDELTGTDSAERIFGFGGDDRLLGRGGDDCIYGHRGNDHIRGEGGEDRLFGLGGRDRIAGGIDEDEIAGGAGRDRIFARDGEVDVVRCGGGRDTVHADPADRLSGCELVLPRSPSRRFK